MWSQTGNLDFPCVSIDSAIVSGCFFQWKAWRHYDDNTGDGVCNNGSGDDDDYDDNCLLLLGLKFYIIMFQKSLRAPVGKIWYWHGDVRTAHSSISWKQGYASVELMIANQNFENLCVISILAMIILQKTFRYTAQINIKVNKLHNGGSLLACRWYDVHKGSAHNPTKWPASWSTPLCLQQ